MASFEIMLILIAGSFKAMQMKFKTVSKRNLDRMCHELGLAHPELALVHEAYGTPPLWNREPGFATLIHIILEQQVSLASAKACFDKLHARLGHISPVTLLTLDDAELKTAGFSRQKSAYARHLAEAVLNSHINLESLHDLPDEEAKIELMRLKGVGSWTADIYLLMAMLRPDVMPRGDVALHTAWHRLSGEPRPTSDEFIAMAVKWSPYRSTAARLLWHFYLSERRPGKS